MTKRGLYKLLALLFSFALIAAACGGGDDDTSAETGTETTEAAAPDDTEPPDDTAPDEVETEIAVDPDARVYGGTVTVGLEAEATGLRPWEDTCASPCMNMAITVFDKLFEIDSGFIPQPYLAESVTVNDDFTEYVVTLRSGVVFHNGVELTAQTIADMFPIQQAGAQSAGAVTSSNLADVQATGDLEVTYTLSMPNSAFLAFLTQAELGFVFEPGAAAADPDGFTFAPVGTGPFVIESRDLDNETVMVRNNDYWRTDADGMQLPYLDSIAFRPIPDEGTRLDSLLSGTVNAMQSLRQATIRDARGERDGGADITLLEFQGNNVGGGMFNVALPPFDDVRVRRGLVQLNNQEQVIEALGGTGISLPGTQWFSPDSPWWSQKVADAYPKFDFDAGVATLQEYVDDPARSDGKAVGEPIDVELSCPPDPTLIAGMAVIQQVWDASGLVNTTLTNFDQQTHIANALGAPPDFVGIHQAHCWRFSSDNDPSLDLNPALAPPSPAIAEAAGIPGVVSPINFSNWFDPEAFTAAVAAIRTDNFEERYALYETIGLRMAEEVPIWFSGHTATMIGVESNIKGVNGWILPSGELGGGFPGAEGRWAEVWVVPE